MTIWGMTGTAQGMTAEQKKAWRRWVRTGEPEALHHGMCIGADYDAHRIVRKFTLRTGKHITIFGHPMIPSSKQAPLTCDVTFGAKPPLDRNMDIVMASDCLFGFPKGNEEELRSGTWATLRRAQNNGVPLIIIWPDGAVGRTFHRPDARHNASKPR